MIGRVLAAALAGLLVFAALAPAAASEAILDYKSRIVIKADSSLTVTETLRVRAEGREIKRGIFRAFPTLYSDSRGGTVRVPFEVVEVLRDGQPEPYHIESASNGKVVYIGKSDVFLRKGEYTYTLTYKTGRQIGYFADYDELYWNVTGSDWTFPRDRIEAVVVLPPGGRVLQKAAYTGRQGAQGKDFTVDYDDAGNIRFRTTRVFRFGEDLTIAVAWPKGLVAEPTESERLWMTLGDHASVLAGIVGLLLVVALHYMQWKRVGRDPERGVIIPLFEPPKGLSPAAVRYVLNMRFNDKAFAAAIVDMAVKGYLVIDAEKRKFTLRRKTESKAGLSPGEKKVAGKLFHSARTEVELKNKNHSIVGGARDALKDALKGEYGRAFFAHNRKHVLPGVALSVVTLMAMAAAAPAFGDTGAVLVLGLFAAMATAAFGYAGGRNLKTAVSSGVPFSRRIGALFSGAVMTVLPLVFLAFAAVAAIEIGALPSFGLLVLLVASNALFIHLMQAPTAAGRRIMDAIEGFRLYLTVAEQPRLDMLHPPKMTPQLYEKYLPYALALDVENAWSEQFAASVDAAAERDDYRPGWYYGRNWNPNNSRAFAGSLSGAFAGALSSSATAPGSSSGSGGGGFSGGGGGGGGGGGW